MGLRTPRGVIELCVALFAFILICNWMAALPTEHYLPPPTADVNLVYPLMLLVIIWVNVAGIRANGVAGLLRPPDQALRRAGPDRVHHACTSRVPSRSPCGCGATSSPAGSWSRSSRCMPAYIAWLPTGVWKLFDMFIGLIQALIFTLLTIIYFSDAVGGHDEATAH